MLCSAVLQPTLFLAGLFVFSSVELSAQIRVEPIEMLRIETATAGDAEAHFSWTSLSNMPAIQIDHRLMAPIASHRVSISGEQIQKSAAQANNPRWRNALIGAAIGAGIRTVAWLGVVCAFYCSGNSNDGMGIEIFATPFFTGVGAVVGGIIGYNRPIQGDPMRVSE